MTTKKLGLLMGCAALLGGLAWGLGRGTRPATPELNGKKVLPDFRVADVARIEIGDVGGAGSLVIASGEGGWVLPTLQDYPADRAKIAENLLALGELKVGQVARGRTLQERTPVVLRDAAGSEVAKLMLGERHPRWGMGRYAEFQGQTVLFGEMLDAFDADPLRWCEPTIVESPRIRFSSIAEAGIADDVTGLSTGVTHTVTIAGDTNRVATIGNVLPGGTSRYLKLDGDAAKWVFVVPSYAVESLLPKEEAEAEATEAEEAMKE